MYVYDVCTQRSLDTLLIHPNFCKARVPLETRASGHVYFGALRNFSGDKPHELQCSEKEGSVEARRSEGVKSVDVNT